MPIVLPIVLPIGPRGLGAPGPKMWDTRGERNYLLSGRLPAVRQATYYQASYLLSGKLPTIRHAPKRSRILCTQRPHADYLLSGKLPTIRQATYCQTSLQPLWNLLPTVRQATYCQASLQPLWNLHPTSAYMHPNVSAYFAPNNRIHAPKYINLTNIIC